MKEPRVPAANKVARFADVGERISSALRLTDASISANDLEGCAISPALKKVATNLVQALDSSLPEETFQKDIKILGALSTGKNGDASGKLWATLASVNAALEPKEAGRAGAQLDRMDVLERVVGKIQAHQLLNLRKLQGGGAEGDLVDSNIAVKDAGNASQILREVALMARGSISDTAEGHLEAIIRSLEGVKEVKGRLPPGCFDPLLPKDRFDASQIEVLGQVFTEMQKEYGVRRQMLIERAKVTLQSMLWSEDFLTSRGTTEQAAAAAENGKARLVAEPQVQLEDVFHAHIGDVTAVTGKVSGGVPGKVQATVKRVLIGEVPDRGGRPTEGRSAASAAAMPSWAPRTSGGSKSSGQGPSSRATGTGRGGHSNPGTSERGRSGRGRG